MAVILLTSVTMSLGATEALRCPLEPTDVEITLIRIARKHEAQIGRPVQKAPTTPLANSVVVSSTAN